MALFITQGRYSDQAMKGMVAHPEDRSGPVSALMQAAGGKLLNYYVTLGEYDFMVITEFEGDAAEFLAALLAAGARGGVTNLKTTQAFTAAEAKTAMEKANTIAAGFKAAGGG